ncbi:MAG: hypothetical protein KGJ13_02170 [Patescibacteria group bacterium]|nr:hypothetical protein [Patescibacteria group bacterium]
MTYSDLYSRFRGENRLYTADPVITPRWFMQQAIDAINLMQDETAFVKMTDSVVIPANGGTLTSPVQYPLYEKHIESVYDDTASQQYGIMEFQQFKQMLSAVYPQANIQRIVPTLARRKFVSTQTSWVSFFNRQIYVAPTPTTQLTLTVQYIPRLPEFSADEPFWNAWDIGNTNDTSFSAAFTGTSIWREYNDYVRAIIARVSSKYLWGVGSKQTIVQAQKCDADFEKTIAQMKALRPNMARGVQIQANDGVW